MRRPSNEKMLAAMGIHEELGRRRMLREGLQASSRRARSLRQGQET